MDEILTYFPQLSEQQKQQLQLYTDRLVWWNARINLISRQDTEHVVQRHIQHSLAIAKSFQFPTSSRVTDIGTGGGLPGIPLAICFPKCSFTLIDGTGKKIKAVQSMIEDLGLTNVDAKHVRAEDFHEATDIVVSRAVTTLADLWRLTLPMIKASMKEGIKKELSDLRRVEANIQLTKGMIVLKGGDLIKEIHELRQLGNAGKPDIISIQDIFPEPYFAEKYIVFVSIK